MPAFSSITAGVGALGGLASGIGGLFGGGGDSGEAQADAIRASALIQAESAREAQAYQERQLSKARDYM